ncbi:MAG: chorismate-binding protein, partial [Sciscionella sp.]
MTPVRVHAIPLAGEVSATQLLLRLGARARRLGIPEPAALIGDWFDSTAVLVPSVTAADRRTDRLSPWRTQPAAGIGPPGAIGGGWIGFLGYPAARRELDSVPAAWGWADHLLRRDRVGQWWFESLSRGRDADPAQASLAAGYAELLAELDAQPRSWWASSMRRPAAETHREAVRGAMAAITAGEVFQTNVCTRFTGRFCGDALALFAAGAAELTPARAAYLTGTWGALASFSPELFLARSGDSLRSMPIKGT